MKRHSGMISTMAFLVAAISPWFVAPRAGAQGCEPIRFTTPVNLGGEGEAYQRGREWEVTVAYRRLVSDRWFVGTRDSSTLAPGGQSPVIKIHTFIADVAYSINDRFRARLSVPISTGTLARKWPDNLVHEQSVTGLGDATLTGQAWILTPRTHQRGNVAVALGVKAPTGSHTTGSQIYTATKVIDYPADQTIQPGDGGWSVILESQAFRQVGSRSFVYASGSYMVSPKAHSDVRFVPDTGVFWSVPDVYSARIGGAFAVLPDQGLTMSLGGRIDGIPIHDLVGGGDESTIKRTSYVMFAEPGASLTRGNGTFTLSVPVRTRVNRMKSLLEARSTGRAAINGGGFAKYLVFASYSHRF